MNKNYFKKPVHNKINRFIILLFIVVIAQNSFGQNVGITDFNTINPNYLLHLHKAASGILFQATNGSTGPLSTDGLVVDIDAALKVMFKNQEAGSIAFFTNTAERLTILSGGNIGVGNTNPTYKFDVSGDVNYTGALRANGSAGTTGQMLLSQGGATNTWLPVGTSGQLLVSTGATPGWQNVPTALNNAAWLTTGNNGLTDGTNNFMGTLDAKPIKFITNGTGNIRMTIASDGIVGVNIAPVSNYQFYVYKSPSTLDAAIYGASGGTNKSYGVYGSTSSTTINGSGVYGYASGATGAVNGVWGNSISNAGSGIYGTGAIGAYGLTTFNGGYGVFGDGGTLGYGGVFTANSSTINGTIYGSNANTDGTAVFAINTATSGIGSFGDAIEAFTAQSNSAALWGANSNASGTGLMVSGNNLGTYYLTTGGGGAFRGANNGVVAYAATVASGTGLIACGNGVGAASLGSGSGVASIGTVYGVYGHANNASGTRWGGYFDNAGASGFAYVGGYNAGTAYKILGGGSVSTIIMDRDNERKILFCPESPEILFQDYGVSRLINGKVHVMLDSTFSYAIYVDEYYPLKVFVQLEGDCEGVYVTNKTQFGFDVVELKNGKSNVSFTWSVIANRKDEITDGIVTSKHVGVRFPEGPGPIKTLEIKTETRKEITKEKPKEIR